MDPQVTTETPAPPASTPHDPPEGGHARRLAVGALVQQGSQLVALASLMVILTVMARTMSLAEFGVFSLVTSFVTYLIVVQGAVSGATMQLMGGAESDDERGRVFTTALLVLSFCGLVAAVLIGGGGLALLTVLHVPARLRPDARLGVLALAGITMIGWSVQTFSDVLRALQRFVLASACEVIAYVVFASAMLVLVLAKAPLWVLIAVGGTSPLLIGIASGIALVVMGVHLRVRRPSPRLGEERRFLRVSAALLAISGADIFITSLDRTILGLFRPASIVALYEGAVRPNTLVRAFAGSLVRTVLPASARFHAAGDAARLHALVIRGTRYVLAATLPVTIVLMLLAGPILEVWLGKRYEAAATALAIFTGTWILGANNSVIGSALVGVGRQRDLVGYTWWVAATNVALSVGLTPLIGLNGVVVGTTAAYVAFFPMLLRIALRALPIKLADLAREVWLPAYSLGAALALALVLIRITLAPSTLWSVGATGVIGVLGYWGAFYGLCLKPDERDLIKSMVGGRRRSLKVAMSA